MNQIFDEAQNARLIELKQKYESVRIEEYNTAIEIHLAEQGIDPSKVAKKDLDQIRRINRKVEERNEKANQKINQFASQLMAETNEVNMNDHAELVKINQKIRKEQGLLADDQKQESQTESRPDNTSAPESDKEALQQS
jgi:uridine kinase